MQNLHSGCGPLEDFSVSIPLVHWIVVCSPGQHVERTHSGSWITSRAHLDLIDLPLLWERLRYVQEA